MQNIFSLLIGIGMLWIVAMGFGYMFRGQRGLEAVIRWPLVQGVRLLRYAVGNLCVGFGNLVVELGRAIRGDHNRRHHHHGHRHHP